MLAFKAFSRGGAGNEDCFYRAPVRRKIEQQVVVQDTEEQTAGVLMVLSRFSSCDILSTPTLCFNRNDWMFRSEGVGGVLMRQCVLVFGILIRGLKSPDPFIIQRSVREICFPHPAGSSEVEQRNTEAAGARALSPYGILINLMFSYVDS